MTVRLLKSRYHECCSRAPEGLPFAAGFTERMSDMIDSTSQRKTPSPRHPPAAAARVIVVLPAYNEEQHIASLIEKIDQALSRQSLTYHVLVVDDGSLDRTVHAAESYQKQLPVTVYSHEFNQGLGRTIRDGLRIAAEMASANDTVVTMDADETHIPGLIPRMLQSINEGRDVVIPSRYQSGACVVGVSFLRRTLSFGASLLFRIVFPTSGVRDFTCGFRAYRGDVLRRAITTYGDQFVESDGFAAWPKFY